jgi:hypothetical protein
MRKTIVMMPCIPLRVRRNKSETKIVLNKNERIFAALKMKFVVAYKIQNSFYRHAIQVAAYSDDRPLLIQVLQQYQISVDVIPHTNHKLI